MLEMSGYFVGLVFAAWRSRAVNKGLRAGRMSAYGLGILMGTSWAFSRMFKRAGVRMFGDNERLFAHQHAYTFVKTNNRFERSRILKNAPFMY